MCSCVYRSFLTFSLTANAHECKKTLVFPMFTVRWTFGKYHAFLCLLESSCIFGDGEFRWIRVNACFLEVNVFISFSCISWDGVFGCFLVRIGRIVGSLPPRVKDSFDLSTVPRPAGYQCSGDLSSFPFPVKTAKTKDIANSKIWFISKFCSTVYYLQMYNYSHKIWG